MSNDGMFSKLLESDKQKPKAVTTSDIEAKTNSEVMANNKHLSKKQISAYLSTQQHTIYKTLYHKLNSTEANLDKSAIVGLSLEMLSVLIGDTPPNFPTLSKLKEYLEKKISKT